MMMDGLSPGLRGCGRSVYAGRPPGCPARQGAGGLTGSWRELAAVVPHRLMMAPVSRIHPSPVARPAAVTPW